MKLNEKVIKKAWKESISTLIIASSILFTIGHVKSLGPETITVSTESIVMDAGEVPSQESVTEIPPIEKVSIDLLVADVKSGKAGNGEDRKVYLGEHYDEVQAIIEEQYKKIETKKTITSRSSDTVRASSGSKAEYQSYAHTLVISMGWSEADFQALVNLWERESGWNPNAHNKSSGAHGIPQSLPASKMATYGDDYYTNGQTQIQWGLNYILNRYRTPSKAWNHFQNKGWY